MILVERFSEADILQALSFVPMCRSRRHVRQAAFYVDAHGCVEGLACAECVTYWLNEAEALLAKGAVHCRDCLRPFHSATDFYSRVVAL